MFFCSHCSPAPIFNHDSTRSHGDASRMGSIFDAIPLATKNSWGEPQEIGRLTGIYGRYVCNVM